MANLFRNIFRSKKSIKEKNLQSLERNEPFRDSLRAPLRSGKCIYTEGELLPTAPYHTIMQPKKNRGPRSCPGELSEEFVRFDVAERSFETDFHNIKEKFKRKHRLSKYGKRNATSEYGSGDPSPTNLYGTYNSNLDDSESDSWAIENEKSQRIRELESKLHEHRRKLKEYKERLRAERDLRLVNERNLMEEIERMRRERKKEEIERRKNDQRYMSIIAQLQSELSYRSSLIEQQRYRMNQSRIDPSTSIERLNGAGEALCSTSTASFIPKIDFTSSTLQNESDGPDETKNFRRGEITDSETPEIEMPRGDRVSRTSISLVGLHQKWNELSILEEEDFDSYYKISSVTGNKDFIRRVHSDSEILSRGII